MDKFGIFNLINSLITQYKSKPESSSSVENAPLLPKKDNIATEKRPSVPYAPLKEGMLKTMTTHDEFVKRVLNNSKPKT
jgi:hypothetical protein